MVKLSLHPKRWPSLLVALVVLVGMVVISGIIATIGIRIAGSLPAFQSAWREAGWWLLLWRTALYSAIAAVWWYYSKPRVLQRLGNNSEATHRLRRLELSVLFLLLLLEALNLPRWLGGS
ncbi:MAG: hypothetical protein JJT87_12445 [Halomonas sp.]|nr:hypothetical protein [Halomonas sp.]MCC5902719.1 hypothetical protein [Halomonas sp.]